MKKTFFLSMLLICISCFSCDKEKQEDRRLIKSLSGDWDWFNSSKGTNGESGYSLVIHSPSTTGKNYGIRIKKNGDIFLYENGKQLKEGKLETIEEDSATYYSVPYYGFPEFNKVNFNKLTFSFDGEIMIFTDESGLTCKNWPYQNYSNTFKTIQ